MRRAIFVAATLMLTAGLAHAGGFAIDEQDAAATGRGGTAAARKGPSAAYDNPAGIAGADPLQVQVGATAIAPSGSATAPDGTRTQAQGALYLPPYAYAIAGQGPLAYGAFFNAPFGLGSTWPDDAPDRFEVEHASFQTLAVMASLAYAFTPAISAGISAGALHTSFDLRRALDFVSQEGTVQLRAGGWGFGAIAGVRYAVGPAAFGFSASLPTPTKLHGTARFADAPPELAPETNDQDLSTRVTLPARLRLGGSFQVAPPLRIDADVVYTLWSSFKSLDVTFSDPNTPPSSATKDWKNGLTAHLGGEYAMPQVATFRAGVSFDQAVSPRSTLGSDAPDGDRWQFSVGAGRALFAGLRVDLAYAYLAQQTRTSQAPNFPAAFTGHAHLIALSLAYALDAQASK